jgi:hypothetical protein
MHAGAAGDTSPVERPHRGRCRPRGYPGPDSCRLLARSRHPSLGAGRGLLVAPGADRRTADHGQRAPVARGGSGRQTGGAGRGAHHEGRSQRRPPDARAAPPAAAGVPAAGQALVHLLGVASAQDAVLRGPMVGAEHAFVGVEQWLGAAPAAVEHGEALTILARRYLAGHAPAGTEDLANWAGIPLRDARAGFVAGRNELVPTRGSWHRRRPPSQWRRGRACWVPLIRCCLAGARGPPSSAATLGSTRATGSSGRWRSSGAEWWASSLPEGRPTIARWSRCPPGTAEPFQKTAPMSCRPWLAPHPVEFG